MSTTASPTRHLIIEPNLTRHDDFYETLIDTHRDLSAEQSHALNARLILLLANHIGDYDVLAEALQRARDSLNPTTKDA